MPATNNVLQYAGDVCGPLVLSQTSPDASARFTVSGTYAGATLVFEKAVTKAEYDAGTWTPLAGVVRQDTLNVMPGGTASGLASVVTDFVAPVLYGLYAVRCRLAAVGSGSLAVQAVTTPRSLTDPNQLLARVALGLDRLAVGVSELTGTDLTEITSADSV